MKKTLKWLLPILTIALLVGVLCFSLSAANAEVEYTNSEGTTQTTFDDALNTALTKGGSIKLLKDAKASGGNAVFQTAGVSLTIDLDSYTLDFSAKTGHAFCINADDVNVDITGTGKIISPSSNTASFFMAGAGKNGSSLNICGDASDRIDFIINGSSNTFDQRAGTLSFTNTDVTVNGYSTFLYNTSKGTDVVINFTDSSITINKTGSSCPITLTCPGAVNLKGVTINNTTNAAVINLAADMTTATLENTTINTDFAIFHVNGKGTATVKDGVVVTKSAWDANPAAIAVTIPSGYVAAYVNDSMVEFVPSSNTTTVTYYYGEAELGSRLAKIGTAPDWTLEVGYVSENDILYTEKIVGYADRELTIPVPAITAETTNIYLDKVKGEPCTFQYKKESGYYILVGYVGEDKKITVPTTFEGLPVTEIAAYAFAGNTAIEEIIIPQGITTVGIGAFKNCTALKSVTIESGVKAIASRAFENTALVNVVVPDSVVAIGHGAFKGCNAMKSITLPFVGANLSDSNNYFGYIFGAISYVSNVDYVPASLNTVILSDACTEVPAYSFVGCSNITTVTFGENVRTIGSSAFQNCTGLKTIYIPITVQNIPANAFFYNSPFIGCTNLTIYTETQYLASFGAYWCNISETERATVTSEISYAEYLKAIAD